MRFRAEKCDVITRKSLGTGDTIVVVYIILHDYVHATPDYDRRTERIVREGFVITSEHSELLPAETRVTGGGANRRENWLLQCFGFFKKVIYMIITITMIYTREPVRRSCASSLRVQCKVSMNNWICRGREKYVEKYFKRDMKNDELKIHFSLSTVSYN
jgi:hypothetical protein